MDPLQELVNLIMAGRVAQPGVRELHGTHGGNVAQLQSLGMGVEDSRGPLPQSLQGGYRDNPMGSLGWFIGGPEAGHQWSYGPGNLKERYKQYLTPQAVDSIGAYLSRNPHAVRTEQEREAMFKQHGK